MKPKGIVFIVEDDKFYNTLITNSLKQKGFIVRSFLSGEELINYNDEIIPNIILLDYMLPGINGIETMRAIKSKYLDTDYILVSGQTEIKIALDAIHEGAYDYIIKDENAKETALNKIEQIIKYKKLIKEKSIYKKSIIIIGSFLIISWILALIFYFIFK